MVKLVETDDTKRQDFYDFYIVLIDDTPEEDNYICAIYSELHGVWTTNEWNMKQFLRFYQPYYEKCKYRVIPMKNCTDAMFRKTMRDKYHYCVDADGIITSLPIPLLGITPYGTPHMMMDMESNNSDFDVVEEVFLDYLGGAYNVTQEFDECLVDERFSTIKELLRRVCDVYIPILIFISEGMSYETDSGECWFNMLPDKIKVAFTKLADFPRPLEELSYYDFVETDYIFYYYLIFFYDYPGKLAYTNENIYDMEPWKVR
jgi:hypothetical protein